MKETPPTFLETEYADVRRVWKPMLCVFVIAFALRLSVFLVGLAHADEKGYNSAFFWYDSSQYLNPALSLIHHRSYTVDSGGKQVPYFTRPVAYPAFIVACYSVAGERTGAILLPQIVMGALACSFVYWIGTLLFHRSVGLIAALLMTFDQTLIAYSNKVMTETFSLCFLSGSTVAFLLFLAHRRSGLLWVSGILLGICTLAHASTLYYWVVLVGVLCFFRNGSVKDTVRWASMLALSFFLTIGIWQVRNYGVFRVYQLSPKGTVLSATATRILWVDQPQLSRDEAEDKFYAHVADVFSQRYGIPKEQWKDWINPELRHRYFEDYMAVMSEEALRVFREHFRTYAGMVRYSVLRITILPLPYAELCRFVQARPLDSDTADLRGRLLKAAKGIFHGRFRDFGEAMRQVPYCKLVGFGWNALYWVFGVPMALIGLWAVFRRWPRYYLILLLGTIGYFSVTTPLTMAGDGMQRYRLRMLPCVYSLAALGIATCVRRYWCQPQLSGSSSASAPRS